MGCEPLTSRVEPSAAELSAAEVREVQLRLLADVARYCEDAELPWFLWAGSLLGAVRHSGYIPWDDDIDIAMPREIYEQFCGLYSTSPAVGSRLLDGRRDSTYPLPFAKICDTSTLVVEDYEQSCDYGVSIDLFPVDNWPDGARTTVVVRVGTRFIRALLTLQLLIPRDGRSPIKSAALRISKPAVKLLGRKTCATLVTRIAKCVKSGQSSHVGVMVWAYSERVPASCYGSSVPVEFEGNAYPAPVGWREVLGSLYGSYMNLPPAEKQITHHSFRAYRLADDRPASG